MRLLYMCMIVIFWSYIYSQNFWSQFGCGSHLKFSVKSTCGAAAECIILYIVWQESLYIRNIRIRIWLTYLHSLAHVHCPRHHEQSIQCYIHIYTLLYSRLTKRCVCWLRTFQQFRIIKVRAQRRQTQKTVVILNQCCRV